MDHIVKIAKITQFGFEMGSLTRKSLFSRNFRKVEPVSRATDQRKSDLYGVFCVSQTLFNGKNDNLSFFEK